MNKIFSKTLKYRNFISDVFLNTLGSFLVTGVFQILVYPYLAQMLGPEEYGYFLTSIGIANIFAVTLGNSLNNTRLLQEDRYKKEQITGDFNVLVQISGMIIVIGLPIALLGVKHEDGISTCLTILIAILYFLRAYYSVGYRIVINYKKLFLQCVIYCMGGILGILLFQTNVICRWQFPFILAEGFAVIYILSSNKFLLAESFKITRFSKDTIKTYVILIFTSLIGNILIYLDRLLLLPLMGAPMVSTYTVASFFGKTIGVIIGPISGVLLTYYAKIETISRRQFKNQVSAILIVSFVMYIVSLLFSQIITGILYPTLISEAEPYIWIANLSAILLCAGNIIQPSVLRFCKVVYQPLIQLVHLVTYILLGYVLMHSHGLMGFCIAVAISNMSKLSLMITLGISTIGKRDVETN